MKENSSLGDPGLAPPTTAPWFRWIVWTALYAVTASTVTQPLVEYDTGWHLRTGEWILQHGQVPTSDPFSTVGPDRAWVAYTWLYDVLLWGMYHHHGLVGILLLRVGLALAIVAALHKLIARSTPSLAVVAGLLAAASVALIPIFLGERPGLLSIVFAIWTLETIRHVHAGTGSRFVWLLPAVYLIWANVHIQFVHGLFLMGLAWLAALISWFARRQQREDLAPSPQAVCGQVTLLGGACFLATLANPYHYHVWEVILTYARQKETYGLFEELKALEFRQAADWCVLGLTCAAWGVLGYRRRATVFEVLLLVSAMWFSFHARHDLWLVVLASCAIMAGPHLHKANAALAGRLSRGESLVLACSLAAYLALRSWTNGVGEESLQKSLAQEFPAEAAAFVGMQPYQGPIWNAIDWGGYLIWRLPNLRVTIDGRAQLHGDLRIKRSYETWKGKPGWQDDPDLAAAELVIIQRAAPLASLLRLDRRFTLVHEDTLAVVFHRSRP